MTKKLNLIKRLTMSLPEYERYYREQRKEQFESNKLFKGAGIREILHPFLIFGLKVLHLFNGKKITIIGNKSVQTNRPIIFAGTHIGWDDIEMIFSSIGKHAYLFWGDPHELYHSIDGFFLNLNGTIIIDTGDKTDRYIGKESCICWLKQGGNLLIFPEGVWNTSENQVVQYMFSGTADMAIQTGADIIPVAIMQYGKRFIVNIGNNISSEKWTQKQILTDYLRDAMASLQWEIYETQPIITRNSIPANSSDLYRQSFIDMGRGTITWKEMKDSSYHPKDVTSPEEAFSFMDKLVPSWENAFLLRVK